MRDAPSPELIELLSRQRLALPRQLAAVGRRVRRLAGNLPAFDSAWLDALVQAGQITPFQAREIKAGRGQQLACGPHVAASRRPTLGYAEVFETDGILLTRSPIDLGRRDAITEQLSEIVARCLAHESACFTPLLDHGIDGDQFWTAWECPEGVRAADWMIENGRFPPLVVLEIARRMLVGMCELEFRGLVHGDLHARTLFIHRGEIALPFAGLRGVLRPVEPSSDCQLPPHCYETLAPERVADAAPPNAASEIFACGCVWWHLLTGRPPIAGGNSAAKRRAAAEHTIPDVRRWAPDTPEVLAELISACTSPQPSDRPRSFGEMARILGPPAADGARRISKAMRRAERWVLPRPRRKITRSRVLHQLGEVAAVAACLLLVVAAWRWMGPLKSESHSVAAKPITPPAMVAKLEPVAIAEPEVQQASFEPPVEKPDPKIPEPLRLPEGRMVRLTSLSPTAGQRICGEADGRVVVTLPADGLTIDVDALQFENIDFLAAENATASSAMLMLRAPSATFSGCRFLGPARTESVPTAIRWESSSTDDWLPTDENMTFNSCAFHRVNAAVERLSHRTASIEMRNVLQTRSACLVRCSLASGAKPLQLELDRCTLRETGAALQITEIATLESRLDRIRIAASDCVFQLKGQRAIIELPIEFDDVHLTQLKWVGTGSLCALPSQLAAIVEHGEQAEVVDDEKLAISGLARSSLSFAGDDLDSATASELRRWVAARRSPEPPGITASD